MLVKDVGFELEFKSSVYQHSRYNTCRLLNMTLPMCRHTGLVRITSAVKGEFVFQSLASLLRLPKWMSTNRQLWWFLWCGLVHYELVWDHQGIYELMYGMIMEDAFFPISGLVQTLITDFEFANDTRMRLLFLLCSEVLSSFKANILCPSILLSTLYMINRKIWSLLQHTVQVIVYLTCSAGNIISVGISH